MVVIGKQAILFSQSGQYADVQAFAKEVKGLPEVSIVDAVIAYDCIYSGETYMLVLRNYLCVPTMYIHLILPFVLRESGLILNDTPKMHCKDPSVEDYSLFDEETGLRIPFTLDGTLSIFETHSLAEDEIEDAENYPTILLNPDSNRWNPYDKSYKLNENSYLDNRGNMIFLPLPHITLL